MIAMTQQEFGNTFTDLSNSNMTSMFDVLGNVEKIPHAQYDLDDFCKARRLGGYNIIFHNNQFRFINKHTSIM